MIELLLLAVTPTTILCAFLVGVILGLVFLPGFGLAIGIVVERQAWGIFVGIEVIGVTFFATMMAARLIDGSPAWIAWGGNIILWTITAATAWLTARLR